MGVGKNIKWQGTLYTPASKCFGFSWLRQSDGAPGGNANPEGMVAFIKDTYSRVKVGIYGDNHF